jgi:hypothetical protein
MADATIRMKLTGIEQTKSDLDAISQRIKALQTTIIPRQEKKVQQNELAGIRGGKADEALLKSMYERDRLLATQSALVNQEAAKQGHARELVDLRTHITAKMAMEANAAQSIRTIQAETAKFNQRQLKDGEAAQAAYWMAEQKQRQKANMEATGSKDIEKGVFSGMLAIGGRRIIRQGAGLAAQELIGAAGAGQEVGLALGGFLYGGPVLGAIATGTAAVTAAMKHHIEVQITSAKIQQEHNATLAETFRWWTQIAAKSTTSFGHVVTGRRAGIEEKIQSMKDQQALEVAGRSFVTTALMRNAKQDTGDFFSRYFVENDMARENASAREIGLAENKVEQLKAIEASEETVQRKRESFEVQSRVREAAISSIINQDAHKKAQLKEDARQQEFKTLHTYEDRMAALRGKYESDMDDAGYDVGKVRTIEREYEKRKEGISDVLRWEQEANRKVAAERYRELEREIALRKNAALDQAKETIGVVGMIGFVREKEALQLRQKSELNAADASNMSPFEKALLVLRQRAALQDQEAARVESMRAGGVGLESRRATAIRDFAGAEGMARDEEALRLMRSGASDVELSNRMALYDKTRYSEINAGTLLQETDVARQLKVQKMEMTEMQALKERLREANPLADQENLDKLAADTRSFQLTSKYESPVTKWEREVREIKEARAAGVISADRERHDIQIATNAIMQKETGRFGTMASRWQEIQGNILRPEDANRLLREELVKLNEGMDKLRSEGIPVRG